ncbi:MAG: hypothetical protein AB7O62_18335 [Pirellulales bacterium]
MPPTVENVAQAHRFFSVDCFNRAWGLIDLPQRKADEQRQMLLLALASIWHWTQRPDCTNQNLSIGYWQVSRVYALLGQAENAQEYGEACLKYSSSLSPFYLAYAHEALARAAFVAKDHVRVSRHLAAADELVAAITATDERQAIEKDLASLRLS